MSVTTSAVYIGIDPGVGGGIALVTAAGYATALPMPQTRGDLAAWFRDAAGHRPAFAVVEQQTPRPTMVYDRLLRRPRPTILKSTCLLYASYEAACALLAAFRVPHEECPPKRWQGALKIVPRKKGEETRAWKNRLKAKAQQLFPSLKVTLATADALLLAEYCKRERTGTL